MELYLFELILDDNPLQQYSYGTYLCCIYCPSLNFSLVCQYIHLKLVIYYLALTWNRIVSVLLLRLLLHSIFISTSMLSSSVRGTGSLCLLVVMMAASQGNTGDPAIRNLVTTWTCMNNRANTVMAVAWTTYTKHSLQWMR